MPAEAGARALSDFKDKGVNIVANTLGQSVDHILSFFQMLQSELAFYRGCLNLRRQLIEKGEPLSFPEPAAADERKHSFTGLYDVCLSLNVREKLVGNRMAGYGKDCAIVTGANQGGKSVFLRSIGLAQLMMQAGVFVPAGSFSANICRGLFTHFKREEDAAMKSGKLDEELKRMSGILDRLRPNAWVLFNESFAATNEREGSEIARQIVLALIEKRIKIFFATHLYDFAQSLHAQDLPDAMFLLAERRSHGTRTFKFIEAGPLDTSHGEDLYNKIYLSGPCSGAKAAEVAAGLP
jgi:DNA mismatch repair ATPase MutS